FAVNVLAGVHCLDRDLHVPVVRRGDHDRVDVFAIENFSIVLVGVGLFALAFLHLFDVRPQHVRIDVCQGREIGEAERLAGDRPALVSKADGRKHRALIGRFIAEGPIGRPEQNAGGSRGGEALKKLTARCRARRWHWSKSFWRMRVRVLAGRPPRAGSELATLGRDGAFSPAPAESNFTHGLPVYDTQKSPAFRALPGIARQAAATLRSRLAPPLYGPPLPDEAASRRGLRMEKHDLYALRINKRSRLAECPKNQ